MFFCVFSLSAQESQEESSCTEQLDNVIIELENLSTSLQNKQIQLEDVEKQLATSQENLEKISQGLQAVIGKLRTIRDRVEDLERCLNNSGGSVSGGGDNSPHSEIGEL